MKQKQKVREIFEEKLDVQVDGIKNRNADKSNQFDIVVKLENYRDLNVFDLRRLQVSWVKPKGKNKLELKVVDLDGELE
jgi:hypothetical protein